jgi:hypothetical protein
MPALFLMALQIRFLPGSTIPWHISLQVPIPWHPSRPITSIPREVAFEVFIGTTCLKGGVSQAFIQGIDAALWISLVLIAIAGVLSWLRGEEIRGPAH